MIERGLVLGAMLTLALGAMACNGDDTTGGAAGSGGTGTDGASGGTGTGGAPGTDGSAGTGGTTGSGGATGTGGGTDASLGGAGGGSNDGGAPEAAPAPRCGPFADGGAPDARNLGDGQIPAPTMSFFVSSDKSMTGNLGGVSGADQRCQTLAQAVGAGARTWRAYLCTSTQNARDRIGPGPWFNSLGVEIAADIASLHMRKGDAAVFLDEHGNMINGQWTGSPTPNEHDVLTGCNADGTLAAGKTCLDWTSAAGPGDAAAPADGGNLSVARIGHTDGYGGMCSTAVNAAAMQDVTSWNSAHDNAGCDNTAPRGGAGRIYCFALPRD